MKRIVVTAFFLLLFLVAAGFAQNPVTWSLESEARGKTFDTAPSFKVQLRAKIEEPWHLYAVEQAAGGPVPTTITASAPEAFAVNGKITSPPPITKFDENFKIQTKYFLKEATFDIPVKFLSAGNA